MNSLSISSLLKYGFGLFLGVLGLAPLNKADEQPIKSTQEKIESKIPSSDSCSIPAYLSSLNFPEYLCHD